MDALAKQPCRLYGLTQLSAFAQPQRSTLRAERSVAVGLEDITSLVSEPAAGVNRQDVGREDREAAAAATAFFDDRHLRIGHESDVADGMRDLVVVLVVERGSVDAALRMPAPIPVPFDYLRGVNVLGRIAQGSLWPLLLLLMRVFLKGMSTEARGIIACIAVGRGTGAADPGASCAMVGSLPSKVDEIVP